VYNAWAFFEMQKAEIEVAETLKQTPESFVDLCKTAEILSIAGAAARKYFGFDPPGETLSADALLVGLEGRLSAGELALAVGKAINEGMQTDYAGQKKDRDLIAERLKKKKN